MQTTLLLIVGILLSGCAAATGKEFQPPAAVPSVDDLDRMTVAVHDYASNEAPVAMHGTVRQGKPTDNGDWLQVDTDGMAWIVRRVTPGVPQQSTFLALMDAATPFDNVLPDGVWAAVADFSTDRWAWRNISETPTSYDVLGEIWGTDFEGVGQPRSNAGNLYLVVLSLGPDILVGDGGISLRYDDGT